MQFKSLLAFFAMAMAVMAAPAYDDHKSHGFHKIDKFDHDKFDHDKFDHDKFDHDKFDDDKGRSGDDHSFKNDVDIKAEHHSSKDDHSNSCGENQTAMCCDSFNKKQVNGLDLLLGQGCLANVLGCTNQAACCKQEGGGLSLLQVCQLL